MEFSLWLRILQTDQYLMVCPCSTIRLIRYVNSLCKILLTVRVTGVHHDRHLVKETRIVVEKSTINSIFLGPNSLLDLFLFLFFFFLFILRDCVDIILAVVTQAAFKRPQRAFGVTMCLLL